MVYWSIKSLLEQVKYRAVSLVRGWEELIPPKICSILSWESPNSANFLIRETLSHKRSEDDYTRNPFRELRSEVRELCNTYVLSVSKLCRVRLFFIYWMDQGDGLYEHMTFGLHAWGLISTAGYVGSLRKIDLFHLPRSAFRISWMSLATSYLRRSVSMTPDLCRLMSRKISSLRIARDTMVETLHRRTPSPLIGLAMEYAPSRHSLRKLLLGRYLKTPPNLSHN